MPDYRRYLVPGATYFFTVVTDGRAPILCTKLARGILRRAMDEVQSEQPFEMSAIVLLPDHIHAIWTLPEQDYDYSKRWGVIKKTFTERFLSCGGAERPVTQGRANQRRRGVWQPRFWEHVLRDETDFERHFDYIHYNPVKHRYVARPWDWEWSTFRRWVKEGVYPQNWGTDPDDQFLFTDIVDTVGE